MPYFHFRCVARATFGRNLIHSADACFLVTACVGNSRAQLKTLSSLLNLLNVQNLIGRRLRVLGNICELKGENKPSPF